VFLRFPADRHLRQPLPTGVWLLLSALFAIHPLRAAATELRAGGTGAALGTLSALGRAFAERDPDVSLAVAPSLGSGGSIRALADGALDLAVSARPLRPEEEARGLRAFGYARTPFVFAAAPGSDVSGVTLDWATRIYAGEIVTWPDGAPIRLVTRPRTESDTLTLAALSPAMARALRAARARPGLILATTDQEAADALERIPGAFGTTTLALIRTEGRAVVPLSLDGVAPAPATIADGTYPHYKTFYLVTPLTPRPEVTRFVQFVRSPAGLDVLKAAGCWARVGGW